MSRMHKPDPKLGLDQQDKRSVVALETADWDTWLGASHWYVEHRPTGRAFLSPDSTVIYAHH